VLPSGACAILESSARCLAGSGISSPQGAGGLRRRGRGAVKGGARSALGDSILQSWGSMPIGHGPISSGLGWRPENDGITGYTAAIFEKLVTAESARISAGACCRLPGPCPGGFTNRLVENL